MYGSEKWQDLAWSRAYPSAAGQTDDIIVWYDSEGDIASARNSGVAEATGDWILFLDADDELADGYLEAMAEAIWAEREDLAKRLFTPRVSYVHHRSRQAPKFWPEQDLRLGNWLVIGTLIQRDFFLSLGGFNSRWHGYEDWELWLKAHRAGAKISKVPKAVYVAHVDPSSRNRGSSKEERVMWHYEIGREHCPDIYNEDWLSVHMPRARAGRR